MARASVAMIGATAATPAHEARMAIRAGRHGGQTAGLAPGYLQGNLAILPGDLALDFARYSRSFPLRRSSNTVAEGRSSARGRP